MPYYRIVATDSKMPRDGRYLELIGTYDPLTNPATVKLKEARIKYWVGVGAKPSATVATLIEQQIPGYLGEISKAQRAKITALHKKRKERIKAHTKKKK